MDDEAAAALIAEYVQPRRCKVRAAGKADIVDALARNAGAPHLIAHILERKFGTSITQNTIRRHVRRECGCP